MGAFSGIGNTTVGGQGVYLTPGRYSLQIGRLMLNRSRKGIDAFIAEFTVVAADAGLTPTGQPLHPAGSSRSWYQGFDKDAALSNIKRLIVTLFDVDFKEIPQRVDLYIEKALEYAVSSDNPCSGYYIDVEVVPSVGKNTGKTFNRHDWRRGAQPPREPWEAFVQRAMTHVPAYVPPQALPAAAWSPPGGPPVSAATTPWTTPAYAPPAPPGVAQPWGPGTPAPWPPAAPPVYAPPAPPPPAPKPWANVPAHLQNDHYWYNNTTWVPKA